MSADEPKNEAKTYDIPEDFSDSEAVVTESSAKATSRQPNKNKSKKIDWSNQGALVLGGILLLTIIMIVITGLVRNRSETPSERVVTEESLLPKTVVFGGKEMPGATFVGMEAMRTEKDNRPGLDGLYRKGGDKLD